jgi:hypothetical protein
LRTNNDPNTTMRRRPSSPRPLRGYEAGVGLRECWQQCTSVLMNTSIEWSSIQMRNYGGMRWLRWFLRAWTYKRSKNEILYNKRFGDVTQGLACLLCMQKVGCSNRSFSSFVFFSFFCLFFLPFCLLLASLFPLLGSFTKGVPGVHFSRADRLAVWSNAVRANSVHCRVCGSVALRHQHLSALSRAINQATPIRPAAIQPSHSHKQVNLYTRAQVRSHGWVQE